MEVKKFNLSHAEEKDVQRWLDDNDVDIIHVAGGGQRDGVLWVFYERKGVERKDLTYHAQ